MDNAAARVEKALLTAHALAQADRLRAPCVLTVVGNVAVTVLSINRDGTWIDPARCEPGVGITEIYGCSFQVRQQRSPHPARSRPRVHPFDFGHVAAKRAQGASPEQGAIGPARHHEQRARPLHIGRGKATLPAVAGDLRERRRQLFHQRQRVRVFRIAGADDHSAAQLGEGGRHRAAGCSRCVPVLARLMLRQALAVSAVAPLLGF